MSCGEGALVETKPTKDSTPFRICLVNDRPPNAVGSGLDPRKRELYGRNLEWIAPSRDAINKNVHVNAAYIGDVYRGKNEKALTWMGLKSAAPAVGPLVEYLGGLGATTVPIVGSFRVAVALARRSCKFVFDPTDSRTLFYLRRFHAMGACSRQKWNSLRLYYVYRRIEKFIVERVPLTIVTSTADRLHLARLCPSGVVYEIGNGTDLVYKPPVHDDSDGCTIGFHGAMEWEPNRLTAKRLATVVAPALAQRKPGTKVRVAGRPVPSELTALQRQAGFYADGFVPDLYSWASRLSLYVMPMYSGAGVKNKLIEAMALGLPVVTNTMGAEMLGEDARGVVSVATSDSDLVEKIVAVLNDGAERDRMRKAARAYAVKHFRWDVARQKLQEAIREHYFGDRRLGVR